MAKGKRRDRGAERKWRELVARQAKSRMSVRAFCKEHGLHETSFYYWRRELRLRDRESEGKPLAPVVVIDEAPSAPIEIELADGVKVRVGTNSTREQLVMVLESLRPARC